MDAATSPSGPRIVEVAGIRIPLDRRIMSDKIVESLTTGRYEMIEARQAPSIVRAGERVVEIGAGIGFLTALIAARTPAELVVAIEANPELGPCIAALHALNGVRTTIRQALVTPGGGGPARFHLHVDLWASSSGRVAEANRLRTIEVPSIGLDQVAADYRPTLLIVDVEPLAAWAAAAEPAQALEAADFRPFPRVLVELKPKRFPPKQVRRVFDLFSDQGFAYSTAGSQGPLVLFEQAGG